MNELSREIVESKIDDTNLIALDAATTGAKTSTEAPELMLNNNKRHRLHNF